MVDFEHVREVFRDFTLSSALEIGLIAVAVFATLRLVSGTRAMTQLRGGLAVFLVALFVGRLFNLTVINFIVQNSLPALLVAGIIIFQPELRRGFDRLGRTGLRGWIDRSKTDELIDAVAIAAMRMSAAHHGGLIVFERTTRLRDIVETGVRVDARVSPELLTGIFFPNSPLHDMAVVLRDDRVLAASCILPLANDLPMNQRGLGTRHRAAIGVTEQTDAVSLVVSEETGAISVALGGRLTPVTSDERLRAVLAWLLEPPSNASGNRGGPGVSV